MITEKELFESGFEKRIFFFEIGGGEDEDDIEIFVKDNIAITYDYQRKEWKKRPYNEISYVNGFGLDDAELVTGEELTIK